MQSVRNKMIIFISNLKYMSINKLPTTTDVSRPYLIVKTAFAFLTCPHFEYMSINELPTTTDVSRQYLILKQINRQYILNKLMIS